MEALPGPERGAALPVALAKAGLRLIGGTNLADAIADLTGLGKRSISQLVQQAEATLQGHPGELRDLTDYDRDAAQTLITDLYTAAAAGTPGQRRQLPVAALTGVQALTDHLETKVGIDVTARTTGWSTDGLAYYQALLTTIAGYTTTWYHDDPTASHHATTAGIGQLLRTTHHLETQLGTMLTTQPPFPNREPAGAWARPEPSWPIVFRGPDRASAYQPRADASHLPDSGTVVLSGPSGYGKTQIAADLFIQSAADLRLWVPASDTTTVLSRYADAAITLNLGDQSEGIDQLAEHLLNWLTSTDRTWLIVLDNLDSPDQLNPTTNHPHRTLATHPPDRPHDRHHHQPSPRAPQQRPHPNRHRRLHPD